MGVGAGFTQQETAAQHAPVRRIARQMQHLAVAGIAVVIQRHLIAEADARTHGGGERLRITRLAQRLRREEVLGGVKLEACRDRRQFRQPFDRFDAGADVAFPFFPMAIPAAMFDVIVRVPPVDVLRVLKEGEPPIQHAPLAAVQIGTDRDGKQAVGAAAQPHLQPQWFRLEQLVDIVNAPRRQQGGMCHNGVLFYFGNE